MSPLPDTQHWHILGAGAIGSLWGCYAYKAGLPATMILRDQATLAAYQSAGGITARLQSGTEVLPLPATCPEQQAEPIDYLLITTKAQQTLDAIAALRPALSANVTLVLMQNGLGVAETLAEHFPEAVILQASTTEGAYREQVFSLVHAGRGQTLLGQSRELQRWSDAPPLSASELARVAASLSYPPLNVEPSDNIDAVLWRKLAINCAINPLTVKYRCRNGELLDNPLAASTMQAVIDEIVQFSEQTGRGAWVKDLLQQTRQVAADTALNRSSMLQDALAGRSTELDFITGELLRRAQEVNISLPANQKLYDQLQTSLKS